MDSRPIGREEKTHRMIMSFVCMYFEQLFIYFWSVFFFNFWSEVFTFINRKMCHLPLITVDVTINNRKINDY